MDGESTENVSTMLQLAAPVDTLMQQWSDYQKLTKLLITEDDYQVFKFRNKDGQIEEKKAKKKSAWRKYARAFNISDEIVKEEKENDSNGNTIWRFHVRAFANDREGKTIRSVIGIGACSTGERNFNKHEHDPYATAHTRAKNRAISDIIGAGEVSAEEMDVGYDHKSDKVCLCKNTPPKKKLDNTCADCGGMLQ